MRTTAEINTARSAKRKAQRQETACQIGRNYHLNVRSLYSSSRGTVSYGAGGLQHVEWLYSKSYKRPARWRDGGARIEGRTLILENHLGNELARFRMPSGKLAPSSCLLQGDCYAVRDGVGAVRYGPTGKTGYAMILPNISGEGHYWEHGADESECYAERARKARLQELEHKRLQESAKDARRLRLLARVSSLIVTRADAFATGSCAPGIDAWCSRNGVGESIPARELVKLATQTGERRAMLAAIWACRRSLA